MISLIFIIPYEELRPAVTRVLEEFESEEEISASIYMFETEDISDVIFHGDVIISRGFSAQMIQRQYPDLVCVPLKVSGYDIVHAIHKAVTLYNPNKIAFIGSRFMVYDIENLGAVFPQEIRVYQVAEIDGIPGAMERAAAEGCDCFIGGQSLVAQARPGDKIVMIETGRATIIQTLDEAVRLTRQTRIERGRAASFRTIVSHSSQGIVFIDDAGLLTTMNDSASRYLQAGGAWLGRPCRKVFPFLKAFLDEVEKTGAGLYSEIITVADQLLAFDIVPTVSGQQTVGIVLFIQSVSSIQKDEALIRKKIHLKGLKAKYSFDDFFGTSEKLSRALDKARQFAPVESPILITGESGTGKELLAQSIHNASPRRDGPFVAINCAALPENLLESELFGYSEGAFTGALKGGKPGLFEIAHGGSIFLDEISEIPIPFQSKLLRVLQENEIRRIGDDKVLSVDIRVITATNRDLRELVKNRLFRQDLLFRLDVLAVDIPPLRDRPEDIIKLFDKYVAEFSRKYRNDIALVSGEAQRLLQSYPWEGNVRELRNIAERICVLNTGGMINEEIVRDVLHGRLQPAALPAEEDCAERKTLLALMETYSGHKGKIAAHLGIDRSTLWRRMKKYHI